MLFSELFYELLNFRSCELEHLPTQRSSSYADNGVMSVFPCQSIMKVSKCLYCLNCPKFGQLIRTKIIRLLYHQMSAFSAKFTQLDFGWGFSPDPAGAAYCNATPDPLTEFKGPYY